MASVNKVILVGNCGKDPEIKTLQSGEKIASFTLATTERYTDRNGQAQQQTEWHNIVCFRKTAELVEKYLRKGTPAFIEGKIRTRSWDDQNGQKHYVTEISVENLQLLGERPQQGQQPQQNQQVIPAQQSRGTSRPAGTFPARQTAAPTRNISQPVTPDTYEPEVEDLPF